MEVDEFLEHYGTKGMRWGVKRDEKRLSDSDKALNISQRSQVRIASSISSLAAVGMASNAAATLFQLQSRFEHLRVLKAAQDYAESSPYIDDAGREAIRQTRSHIVKGIVGSAVAATAVATAVGIVTRRTAKAYFAPLHKVYGDEKPKINREIKQLSKDIKNGKRPKLTNKQYETEVASIVAKHMTADASNALRPFHELARSQLGTEYNTKSLKISFEKLPNTELYSKMTVKTPTGLKLVKAIKNVEHADSDTSDILAPDLELFFDYKFDADGHIVDWSCPTIEVANDLFEGRFDMIEVTKKLDPTSNLQHSDPVDEFLEHYGTKGMRWGVRKNIQSRSGEARAQYVADKERPWWTKAMANPKIPKMTRIAARDTKKQLRKLKQEYKTAGHNVKKNGLHQTRYDSEVSSILQHSLERASYKVHGRSPTGLYEIKVHRHPDGEVVAYVGERNNPKIEKQWRKIAKSDIRKGQVAENSIDHSDVPLFKPEDLFGLEFKLIVDSEGFFDDIQTPFDDQLEQNDSVDEFLEHYGTKGMRWGVRRSRSSSGSTSTKTTSKKTTKPAWQRPPIKKAPPPSNQQSRGRFVKAKKGQRVLSEEAKQLHDIRLKVKKQGIHSLTNKELETVNKRIELQAKYQKAHPKKKNPFIDLAIDGLLSEYGSQKVIAAVDRKNPAMAQVVEAAIAINKMTRSGKNKK